MTKGYSVHIGLNELDPKQYDGWDGRLTACVADAEAMEAIAKARGFTTHRLTNGAATRAALTVHLASLSGILAAGDQLLVTYSGHGGSVPDRNGDEDDAMDETWCLYDGQVLDDELNQLYAKFAPGVRIVVFSDSCHSGTVTKGQNPPVRDPLSRAMPLDVVARVYSKHRDFYDGLQVTIPKNVVEQVKASVLLISGCMDDQTSLDGPFNGAFTSMLLRVWNNGSFTGDLEAFHQAILGNMPKTQQPNLFEVGAGSQRKNRPFVL